MLLWLPHSTPYFLLASRIAIAEHCPKAVSRMKIILSLLEGAWLKKKGALGDATVNSVLVDFGAGLVRAAECGAWRTVTRLLFDGRRITRRTRVARFLNSRKILAAILPAAREVGTEKSHQSSGTMRLIFSSPSFIFSAVYEILV